MSRIFFLNGEFTSEEDALISPNDRGFLFADGVYEVIKYYYGKPFRFDDHLKRLDHSLQEIQINYRGLGKLKAIFEKLVLENSLSGKHAGVYTQITRGIHKRVHHFPEKIIPTVYAFAFEFPSFRENLEKGIKVIMREDIRWLRCDIKSVSLLPNTMLYNQAVEMGAFECLLVRNGNITEATHSSVFGVKKGVVVTHPLSNLILPGITRQVVLEICRRNEIPIKGQAISEEELFELDELFVTGTGNEITPVVQIEDKPVGNKKPGEITRFIQKEFFDLIQ